MSFIQKVGLGIAALSIPACAIGESVLPKYLEKKFPPVEKIQYCSQQIINHNGELYKILGFSGHAENTAKNLDVKSGREVWIGDYRVAQEYAKINAGNHSRPVVAVIAQPINAENAPIGPSRYENQFAPYLPKEEHKFTIIDFKDVNIHNDTTITGSVKRAAALFLDKIKTEFLDKIKTD